MKRSILVLASVAITCLGVIQPASAAIIAQNLGTVAPPATLGGYTMTKFADDLRPVFTNVTTVPSPLGGNVTFGAPASHREVRPGGGWATWGHGYTGAAADVYFTPGALSLLMTLPASTGAFYFYAEPNPFGIFNITATANDGTFLTIPVNGNAGATGYGFFSTAGTSLTSITVTSSRDFAVGEFGIAAAAAVAEIPEPTSIALFGMAMAGAFYGWRRRQQAIVG